MDEPTEVKKNTFILFAALAILIVGGVLVYKNVDPVVVELNTLKLLPKAETFTELYFNNQTALPNRVVPGTAIAFSFTIHNLEGVTTTYPYTVYFVQTNGDQFVFANGNVTLSDTTSTSIAISQYFPSPGVTGTVVVNLTGRSQKIDFLISNTK